MKKVFITIMVVCALSLSVFGTPQNTNAASCESIESLTRSIMRARQVGVSMVKVITSIKKSGMGEGSKIAVKRIIIDAYDTPRYNSREYRQNAVDEFANRYYKRCVKSRMKD